jgi:formylglycine-generating enzyme required for sulfatase activity
MPRKDDLEQALQESYDIIRDCETILRTSTRPEERSRARHTIQQQRELIDEHQAEYRELFGHEWPGAAQQPLHKAERDPRFDDRRDWTTMEKEASGRVFVAYSGSAQNDVQRVADDLRQRGLDVRTAQRSIWAWMAGAVLVLLLGSFFLGMTLGPKISFQTPTTHTSTPGTKEVRPSPSPTTPGVAPVITTTLPIEPSPTLTSTARVPTVTSELRRPPEGATLGSTWTRPTDGAVMVYVPAGEFPMGSYPNDPDASSDEKERHNLSLNAFWIDQTEVTNAQFRECVAAGHCQPPSGVTIATRDDYYTNAARQDHPVVHVTWSEASDYAEWVGGRLPTEAEWEYACRGSDGSFFPWGDDVPDEDLLNYHQTSSSYAQKLKPVGSYPDGKSWCGALNLAGNVREWTQSLYQIYRYEAMDGREDPDKDGNRAIRGGAFYLDLRDVRCAKRWAAGPNGHSFDLGFRVSIPVQQE